MRIASTLNAVVSTKQFLRGSILIASPTATFTVVHCVKTGSIEPPRTRAVFHALRLELFVRGVTDALPVHAGTLEGAKLVLFYVAQLTAEPHCTRLMIKWIPYPVPFV